MDYNNTREALSSVALSSNNNSIEVDDVSSQELGTVIDLCEVDETYEERAKRRRREQRAEKVENNPGFKETRNAKDRARRAKRKIDSALLNTGTELQEQNQTLLNTIGRIFESQNEVLGGVLGGQNTICNDIASSTPPTSNAPDPTPPTGNVSDPIRRSTNVSDPIRRSSTGEANREQEQQQQQQQQPSASSPSFPQVQDYRASQSLPSVGTLQQKELNRRPTPLSFVSRPVVQQINDQPTPSSFASPPNARQAPFSRMRMSAPLPTRLVVEWDECNGRDVVITGAVTMEKILKRHGVFGNSLNNLIIGARRLRLLTPFIKDRWDLIRTVRNGTGHDGQTFCIYTKKWIPNDDFVADVKANIEWYRKEIQDLITQVEPEAVFVNTFEKDQRVLDLKESMDQKDNQIERLKATIQQLQHQVTEKDEELEATKRQAAKTKEEADYYFLDRNKYRQECRGLRDKMKKKKED